MKPSRTELEERRVRRQTRVYVFVQLPIRVVAIALVGYVVDGLALGLALLAVGTLSGAWVGWVILRHSKRASQ